MAFVLVVASSIGACLPVLHRLPGIARMMIGKHGTCSLRDSNMAIVLIVDDPSEIVEFATELLAKGTPDYGRALLAILGRALRERRAAAAA